VEPFCLQPPKACPLRGGCLRFITLSAISPYFPYLFSYLDFNQPLPPHPTFNGARITSLEEFAEQIFVGCTKATPGAHAASSPSLCSLPAATHCGVQ